MSSENLFILHAFLYGHLFSFLYDCIRCFRRLFPHGSFWVHVENLSFWGFCSAEVFLFLHREGNGLFRWYAVLAAAMGIWIYARWVSPVYLRLSVGLLRPPIRLFGRICGWFKGKVTGFLKMLLTSLGKVFKMICKGVMKHVGKLWVFRKKTSEEARPDHRKS